MTAKEYNEQKKHERLVKLGKAMFELTKQSIIATVVMSILFPFTAMRLRRLCQVAHECMMAGDLGDDKEILG